MTDVKHSGYKADAVSIPFTGTQQIDGLLDNEWTDESDEINNTNGWLFADFELVLGSAVFTTADSAVEMYIIPAVDGTNYPLWGGGGATSEEPENNAHFVGSFATSQATEAQRLTLRAIDLPPGKWKVGLRSRAGVTLNGSGNTLKFRPWQYSSA